MLTVTFQVMCKLRSINQMEIFIPAVKTLSKRLVNKGKQIDSREEERKESVFIKIFY